MKLLWTFMKFTKLLQSSQKFKNSSKIIKRYDRLIKTVPHGKLNDDTMASYESPLIYGTIKLSRCAAGKNNRYTFFLFSLQFSKSCNQVRSKALMWTHFEAQISGGGAKQRAKKYEWSCTCIFLHGCPSRSEAVGNCGVFDCGAILYQVFQALFSGVNGNLKLVEGS